jgi:hypothetical protein
MIRNISLSLFSPFLYADEPTKPTEVSNQQIGILSCSRLYGLVVEFCEIIDCGHFAGQDMDGTLSRPLTRRATRQVAIAEKTARILELRKAGLDIRAIAEQTGVSRSRVHQLLHAGLRSIVASPAEALKEQSIREIERVKKVATDIIESFTPLVQGGAVVCDVVRDPLTGEEMKHPLTGETWKLPIVDRAPAIQAAKLLLQADESLRKLLGADAPTKVAAVTPSGAPTLALVPTDAASIAALERLASTMFGRSEGTIDVIPREVATSSGDKVR